MVFADPIGSQITEKGIDLSGILASDKKEVHWEESTDGGGEAIPTVELLSAQLSLDQVTMEAFPQKRSLAVRQTRFSPSLCRVPSRF